MNTTAMRTIPETALPALPAELAVRGRRDDSAAGHDGPVVEAPPSTLRIVTARDDSPSSGPVASVEAAGNPATSRDIVSSDCWTRTSDPAVNSRLLYQLS